MSGEAAMRTRPPSDVSPEARYAYLDERVAGLSDDVSRLDQRISNIGTSISSLHAKLDERSKTPWATLIAGGGFILALTLAVGALAYRPIETSIIRVEREIEKCEAQRVPRAEHAEIWRRYDQQISYIQRQIDDQARRFGDTYSLRDALNDLQKRLDKVESRQNGKN